VLKRVLILGLLGALLSACGVSGVAIGESPTTALAAAAEASGALKSYRIQFTASETFPLPPSALNLFGGGSAASGAGGAAGNFKGDFSGIVKVVKPDRFALDATAKLNGFSIDFSAVRIGVDTYIKNPFTSRWEKGNKGSGATGADGSSGSTDGLGNLDPATFTDLLKYVTLDQAFADTDINGTRVHHYRVKLDAGKLRADLSKKGGIPDAKTSQVFDDFVKNGKYTMEVWVGTADHLVRRVTLSFDATTDAGALGGFSLGGGAPKASGTPQPVHVTAHAQLDYLDFNKNIEIAAPAIT
jgi:hypothetical protein